MRILHVADLHFKKPWFDWLSAQARNFDAVCIAGDLLDIWIAREISLRTQTKWIREWARYRFDGRLFLCSGNHDWWSTDEIVDTDADAGWLRKLRREDVTTDNQGADVGGVFIYCHPYATRGPLPQAPAERWILLHHEPPAGCVAAITGDSGSDLGSRYLQDSLSAATHPPLIVLSGHVHHPKSWRGQSGRSWVGNPCYDDSAATPNRIILDFATGIVTWNSERQGEWPLKIF